MAQELAGIDVGHVIGLMQGFMASAAIKAGLELEVFTHIAKGNTTAEAIAAAKKTSVRAMRILCDALVAQGLLAKADGRYSLPPTSAALLVKGSPMYLGSFAKIGFNPVMWEQAGKLTEVVKAGHSLLAGQGAEAPNNPFWQEFNRASRQVASAIAPGVAELAASLFPGSAPRKILDIACGSGIYGFNALKRFPEARLTSVDWPGVLEVARPIAQQMGLEARTEFRPGDIFKDELGTGYDLVLAVNIYHHFSLEKNLDLSRRLYEAALPGGTLLIVDFVPDEKRERDRQALMFALTMLIWTQEGDTYTLSEYERMVVPAGWKDVKLREVAAPAPTHAVVARK